MPVMRAKAAWLTSARASRAANSVCRSALTAPWYRTDFHKASVGNACRRDDLGAIRPVIAPGVISRLPAAAAGGCRCPGMAADPPVLTGTTTRPAATPDCRRCRPGPARPGRPPWPKPSAGAPGHGAGDAARLPGRLAAFRPLVRPCGLRAGAGGACHGRRLPGQPGRKPCAEHHPPPPRRTGQDAPLQRPAVEPGASRHPGTAARRAAQPRPAGAQGGGADARHAAPAAGHLRHARRVAGATGHCCCSASPARCAARNWWRCRSRTSRCWPVGCGCGWRGARPTRRGRGPRSACRGANMSRPARCGRSRPGRRWPSERAGPLFRRVSTGGPIGDAALHPDAVRRILALGSAWPAWRSRASSG